jgi:cupin 2 domain-containing protein
MSGDGNLLNNLPSALPDEVTEVLLRGAGGFRLERIVSHGQASPPGFWYDQNEHEWVLLLEGAAGLRFGDEPAVRELGPGDSVLIPAHRRHRVEWTRADAPTVWLALFWEA